MKNIYFTVIVLLSCFTVAAKQLKPVAENKPAVTTKPGYLSQMLPPADKFLRSDNLDSGIF